MDDFYSEWALANGWVAVHPDEDRWVSDRWVTFLTYPDTQVHQLTRAWKKPIEGRSLLFALRRFDESQVVEVFIVHAPEMVVSPPDEVMPSVEQLMEMYGEGHVPQRPPSESVEPFR